MVHRRAAVGSVLVASMLAAAVVAIPPATAAGTAAAPAAGAVATAAPALRATRVAVNWPAAATWNVPVALTVRVSPAVAGRVVTLATYWGSEQGWVVDTRTRTNARGTARVVLGNVCVDGACGPARTRVRVTVAPTRTYAGATSSATVMLRPGAVG